MSARRVGSCVAALTPPTSGEEDAALTCAAVSSRGRLRWQVPCAAPPTHLCQRNRINYSYISRHVAAAAAPLTHPQICQGTATNSCDYSTQVAGRMKTVHISSGVSVLSLRRRLGPWRYPHLLLNAGACCTAPAAVDRYLLPAGRSAANSPAAVADVDPWDRWTSGQTDGRMDVRPLHRPVTRGVLGSWRPPPTPKVVNFFHYISSLYRFLFPSANIWSLFSVNLLVKYTIRYDTRCYFNVRSKADISRLNLPYGNDN